MWRMAQISWSQLREIQATKDTEHVVEAMHDFKGPTDKVESFYSDGAPDLKKAARKMEWCADYSAPHRPKSNGYIERVIRKVVERTRAALEQAGFHPMLWPQSLEYQCHAHNIERVPENELSLIHI